jgi:aminoglycoside 6'-N-acetyltransferase
MLIRPHDRGSLDFHGLTITDLGAVAEGSASAAVVGVPARGEHPFAYSSACHKLYFVLEGRLRFVVGGVHYTAESGDAVVASRGTVFAYSEEWGAAARCLLIHIPPFDADAEHVLPDVLREHDVHLRGERVYLRPMTENDWGPVLAWNADPEVLIWADCTDEVRPPEDTKGIYREVSVFAHVFIIEFEGEPIGECWLQTLNLPDLVERFPGRDLRRIDLMIGRKDLWGQGLGTDTLRTLVRFGFEQERADGIFGMVDPSNRRSRRAFEKAGFRDLDRRQGESVLVIWREAAEQGGPAPSASPVGP